MDNKNDFPTQVTLEQEADKHRLELRKQVQKCQSGFLRLKALDYFTMPPSLEELTLEYVKGFYGKQIEAVAENPEYSVEENQAKKKRIINCLKGRQMRVVELVNTINNAMFATQQLVWKYDEQCQVPTPTVSVDEIAMQMATVDVPDLAIYHHTLIDAVRQAYGDLRQWEEKNNVARKPLQHLFAMNANRLAKEWASGGFGVAEAPDSATAETWALVRKNIF